MARYAILGPLELWDSDRRVPLAGPQQTALLGLLLINANRALSNHELIETLWGDPGTGAVKRLQVAIARLRRVLDPAGSGRPSALQTTSGGYLLSVGQEELDAALFQTRAEDGRSALERGDPARARDLMHDALGLWRGPPLAEFAYEDFAQPEIRRLEALHLAALETRVESELELGAHAELVGELEALVAAHPGRERLVAQLMLALYRCGRQGDALDVYARARAYLTTELGLSPGPALQARQAEVLAQSPALLAAPAPAMTGPPESPDDVSGAGSAPAAPPDVPLARALDFSASRLLVGRDAELAELDECWARAAGGALAAVMLSGEAGIGKTRLAGELAGRVHGEGALVLYGRCDEGLAVPYQPFVEAVRPYVHAVSRDRLQADLGHLATELVRLLPELTGLGDPIRADPESERFALFEAVAALAEAASRDRPVLLVLDDLHWAAQPTLLLLRHLLRSERPLRLLLVGTYRDTEMDPGHRFAQLLADLHRDANVQIVGIRGLDEPAIAALLASTAGDLGAGATDLVPRLRVQTAGNPFFVRELVAHLVETGAIERAAGRPSLDAPALDVPERLRLVIGSRVARLGPEAQRVLRIAAVVGPTSSLALLEVVAGDSPGVLDAIDEAVAAGLLVEAEHGDIAFEHALVRQTLYRELGAVRRMRLHVRIAEALEATPGPVERLAHHFAEAAPAGFADKAVRYGLAAARSAIERLGYEEAAGHCERALAVLQQPYDARRCELLLALAEAWSSAGDIERARETCMQAADLAESIDDDQRLARAALAYCGPLFFSIGAKTTAPSVGLLARALDHLGEDGGALRAQLTGRLAAAFAYAGAEHRRPDLAAQALAMAREAGDPATLADVLATTHWSLRGPDSLEECLALVRELTEVAGELGELRLRTYAGQWHVDHLLELGEIEAVDPELERWQRRLEPLSRRHYLGWLLAVVRARHAHLAGRLDESEALARDALTHGFEGPDQPVAHTFAAQILFLRREQGRLGEIESAVEQFSELYPNILAWRCARAWVYVELGRDADAREVLDGLACDDFAALPRDGLWLGAIATLCEIVAHLDDAARARTLYDLLLPFADRCVVLLSFICSGSAARPLGLLAGVLGRYEEAQAQFEAALERNRRIRSPLWVANTQYDYARVLLKHGRAEDRVRALALLDDALVTAQDLGLSSLATKVRPLRQSS